MPVVYAVAVPHPPLIIPQVGKGQERGIQSIIDAYRAAMAALAGARPDAVVLASPHAAMYSDYLHVSPGAGAAGDFGRFGAPGEGLAVHYDQALAAAIVRQAEAENLAAGFEGERDPALDHGSLIPLVFLREAMAGGNSGDASAKPGLPCPVVRLGLSGLPYADHYRLGRCVARAAGKKRVAFIASGDLSHKLLADGPYGYAPEGPALDAAITAALAAGAFGALLEIDPALADAGAECGLRAFIMMAGALDGLAVAPELLSYEGPFGVGYAVATFEPAAPGGPEADARRFLHLHQKRQAEKMADMRAKEDPWVRLARAQIEDVTAGGAGIPPPAGLPDEMTRRRAGVFVSLHLDGRLRGCIGTTAPTTASVAEEIMQNAVSAALRDPRFPPVGADEVPRLEISVDVLGEPEPVKGEDELDPARYGVIVTSGTRRGLLLPDLEGVDDVAQQVAIARQKAGIGPNEPVALERFEVVRHV